MKNILYKLRTLFGMNYKSFFKTINMVHERCGKSKIWIFFDIIRCQIKYGSGHNDYRLFAFYDMTDKQKDTYLTRVRNKKIIEYLNDQEYRDIFDNKALFNERFKKYLKRDTADINKLSLEEFDKFINKHKIIFCKPACGDSGRGIERLSIKDFKTTKEMYNYIKEKNINVLEQVIIQHKDMSKVNSACVNCMRLVTVVNGKNVDVIYGVVKFGGGKSFVDNMSYGTMSCPIDLKTGKIYANGQTEHEEVFKEHPVSNVYYIDFQIPCFKEAVKLVKEAALEIPTVRQVGWDIGISENGPVIVEGNDWTDYMFWQLPEHNPNKEGLMTYYRKIIKDKKITK